MTYDIVEELRASSGFKVFRASDGHNAIAADTALMHRAAAEIERLRAKLTQYEELTCWPAMDDGTCACCDERRALKETP